MATVRTALLWLLLCILLVTPRWPANAAEARLTVDQVKQIAAVVAAHENLAEKLTPPFYTPEDGVWTTCTIGGFVDGQTGIKIHDSDGAYRTIFGITTPASIKFKTAPSLRAKIQKIIGNGVKR